MQAIRVHETGGPEVMRLDDVPVPAPAAGQAVVRIEAIGVNFIDVYYRTGQYAVDRPFTPGSEAAGVVTAVGAGVTDVRTGDRVAYANIMGAYAEQAAVPADRLVPVPDGVTAKQATPVSCTRRRGASACCSSNSRSGAARR
jgi:NADPH:quinone reductase